MNGNRLRINGEIKRKMRAAHKSRNGGECMRSLRDAFQSRMRAWIAQSTAHRNGTIKVLIVAAAASIRSEHFLCREENRFELN